MSKYIIEGDTLTGIADAIRNKTGETAAIPVSEMATKITNIGGGGIPMIDRPGLITNVTVSFEIPDGAIVYYFKYEDGKILQDSAEYHGYMQLEHVIKDMPIYIYTPQEVIEYTESVGYVCSHSYKNCHRYDGDIDVDWNHYIYIR